ncbi:DUF262 domain-containing protein [Phascolarctobacterium faecium]|jgi:Protein of unknown function DUF262.|uniref:DUF262 domain-containing protein n=1 Tax=Phascolarctobacterium faecium TaxID=33025 RepID=UPI00265DAD68|nr:DUF262 domain-containing protein [Phascolarctobacterium faecium]
MNNDKCGIEEVEEEIYKKRSTVRYDIRDLTVEAIADKYEESICDDETKCENKKYNYIYIPEYQRDFTWDEVRQSKLIESIILGLPIPFIFVAENKDSSWELVDGSQRVRTIYSFLKNKLKLNGLQSIKSLNGYKFEELDSSRQGKILNTALRIIVLSEETTEDVKKDMFERINRGSDLLKPMEKRKGIYPGRFTTFIYRYCEENRLYKDSVQIDGWLKNRQEREELLLRYFAITEDNLYEKGLVSGISSYLDEYLERKNKELDKLDDTQQERTLNEYKNSIDNVVKYVEENFPYGFRHMSNPQTKRSVFEAISVGVWKAINDGKVRSSLDKEEVAKALCSNEFKKYTHVANELHKKQKLYGRVMFIYNLVSGQEV